MATTSSCAHINSYILSKVHVKALETDLVACGIASWTFTCHLWVYWVLKNEIQKLGSNTLDRLWLIQSVGKIKDTVTNYCMKYIGWFQWYI